MVRRRANDGLPKYVRESEEWLRNYLHPLDQILGQAFEYHYLTSGLPSESGIYFLMYDGDIVYVGKASNLFRRLQAHWMSDKLWTHCSVIQDIPVEALDEVEYMYMAWLRPVLNIKPGERSAAADSLIAGLEPYEPFECVAWVKE